MGNLMVENDRLRLYKTKPSVMIRVDPYKLSQEKQYEIFEFLTPWESSGFKFKFSERDVSTSANELLQERQAQDAKWRTGRPMRYGELTAQQEQHLYIDFTEAQSDKSLVGQAHQRNWKSPFQQCESSRISIDLSRNFVEGDVLHEVGHALGLAHEHQRIDRDGYVEPRNETQYNARVQEGQQVWMHPENVPLRSVPFGPYDYGSIMHYPEIFVRIQDRGDTGGTVLLSEGDLHTARFLYNETRIHEYLNSGRMTREKKAGKQAQKDRQQHLMPPYTQSDSVIKRTLTVVEGQLDQLRRLELRIEEKDQHLFDWARQIQAEEDQENQDRRGQGRSNTVTLFQPETQTQTFVDRQGDATTPCCT